MARRSFIRRGCYGQAPLTAPVKKYVADLGPRPTERAALINWLWDFCIAPDSTIEQRNAAAIERRALLKAVA